jgi:type II secretory pathway pseudopilin PulG
VALIILSLAVAAPSIAKSIQRDREVEAFHRGMQYRRAIQLYYRKYHAYPPTVDALVKTQEIRFLRKKYVDPLTGKDDWKPILFGQNKVPTAMGFFGQPIGGDATTIAGTGPSGGNGLSSPGTPNSGVGGSNSIFGSSPTLGSSGTSPTQSPTGTPGAPGAAGATTTPGPPSSTDQSSQTFGGAGIIGFSPASPKQAILVYKKKTHYNEWEFTYDPISDAKSITGGNNGTIGQPAGSSSNPFGGPATGTPGTGLGSGAGTGSGSGPTSGGTSGSTPSPSPTPPQ